MVGVIIPVYNRTDALRMALKSLTMQTKKMFITFVIDDCSTDNIKDVCDEFKQLHIVYHRLSENKGAGQARQKGLEMAYDNRIDSVIFMDADDMYMPNAIERLTYELNHTKYNLIVSDIVFEHKHSPDTIISAKEASTWTVGKIYRMSFLKENGIIFPKDFRTNEDLAFNLCVNSALKEGEKAFISQQLYLWRDDKESVTRSGTELSYKCKGEDYINAIYYHFDYCKRKMIKLKTPINIFACYNYYQQVLGRGDTISKEIDDKLIKMLADPEVKTLIKNRKNWYSAIDCVNSLEVEDKKIIFYKETFYDWLKRMNFDFNLLEMK